ncbi:MAG: hypothetical protein IT371_13995 [Deltaproteobacteria bacterium]|nr:hypothetical protein [Deltaproteobacteria bacterium]
MHHPFPLAARVAAAWLLVAAAERPLPADPGRARILETRLLRAHADEDSEELTRVARHLGPARIAALLADRNRALRTAALSAAPHLRTSFLLLAPLVELMQGQDRPLAAAAARAVRRITEDLRVSELERYDEMPSTLRPLFARVLAVAVDRAHALDVRTEAILALAQTAELLDLEEAARFRLLADPDPRVRTVAVELLATRRTKSALGRLARLAALDPSPAVARAALVTLCGQLPEEGGVAKEPALEALQHARAQVRLRRAAEDAAATDDELLDLGQCLRRLATPADRQAYARLRARSPHLQQALPPPSR